MKFSFQTLLITCLTGTLGFGATPLVNKGGTCPDLTQMRENPDPADDWTKFNVKPSPASSYPAGTIQKQLTPEQSINCIQTPAGLKAELWASEKSPGGIAYPQHFTFDERGRMWLVEPRSYPDNIRAASGSVTDQKFVGGADRILILEDTDGDRVMDKVKVFRDGLNMPQSIEVVKGGVVVSMAPYAVYFPNNNDTAGTPVILFSGMGNSGTKWDTHSDISSFVYGLDNWIYGIDGWEACRTENVDCSNGKVYRFRHTAMGSLEKKFELYSTKGPYNAWGVGVMEDGQIFQSGATNTPHINHSLRRGKDAIDIRFDPVNANNKDKYYPITGDRYYAEGSTQKQNNVWTTGSTAVSGLHFYTSRLFPQKYWGRFAFTCEGASKLCNQDSMVVSTNGTDTGSTWRAVRMPGPDRSNILASTDAWVAPLLARTGPDGAVWILDWNNYLFLHNPLTPAGPSFAWINKLRTKNSYRIYRVTPDNDTREPVLNLTNATVPQLIAALSNPNFLWRLHAQRQLIYKGYSAEIGTALEAILTTSKQVDVIGNDPAVTHAIWTLEGMGQLASNAAKWDPILKKLLLHPAWAVRMNVLKAMPRTAASAAAINDQCSVNDNHGHVRLQAFAAWAEIASKPASPKAVFARYANVDTYATTAVTEANLTTAAALPCEPPLEPPVSIQPKAADNKVAQPRSDLKFTATHNGFLIHNHQQLGSGTLMVFAPSGHLVFESQYDASRAQWSQPKAEGLKAPVYMYLYRSAKGEMLKGHISLAAGL
jgi:uncharacterized protein